MLTCSIEGCDKPHLARGFCAAHYRKWRRTAAPKPSCKVSGCTSISVARGLCDAHWKRLRRHGDPDEGRTSPGEPLRFFREVVLPCQGDACLIWPFNRDRNGRGVLMVGGLPRRVSRLACEAAHGPAPSERHESAHSCGKGHEGCVNPKHVRWKTPKENNADKRAHGTIGRKLTEDDVRVIRKLANRVPLSQIADQFDVTYQMIWRIHHRKSWAWVI
jgi:hypothetical protein